MSSTTKPTDRVPSKASDVYLIQGLTAMLNALSAASMSCAEQHEKLLESHRKLLEERDEARKQVAELHEVLKSHVWRPLQQVVGSSVSAPSSNGATKVDTDEAPSLSNIEGLLDRIDKPTNFRVTQEMVSNWSELEARERECRKILGAQPNETTAGAAERVVRDLAQTERNQRDEVQYIDSIRDIVGARHEELLYDAVLRIMDEHAAISATLKAHEAALSHPIAARVLKLFKAPAQRAESVAGGSAEGAAETAENKTAAPPSTDESHKWTVAERIARAAIAWCRSRKWTDTRAEVEWLRSSQDPSDHKLADLLELVEQSRGQSPRHGAAETNGARR